MPHLTLLGDSIFDNASYVARGDDVTRHLRDALPDWQVDLAAIDGAVIDDVPRQLVRVAPATTHVVLSVGGNDALRHTGLLSKPARNSAEVLGWFAEAAEEFEARYRRMLAKVLQLEKATTVCTIYNGNLDAPTAPLARTALAIFDDAILRVAMEHGLSIVELRRVCTEAADYANPIEPSGIGGRKIARAIASVVR